MKVLLASAFLAIVAATACSSSSSGNGSGGSCNLADSGQPLVTTVTKANNSDALCPSISPGQLNAGSGSDGGAGACAPVVSSNGCSASYDCTLGPAHLTGSFTVTGTSFTGSITVSVSGTTSLMCSYNISGTVS
jgi:hypothetical protein